MACSHRNHYYPCSFHTVSMFLPLLLLHPDLHRASGFNWPACSQSSFSIPFTKWPLLYSMTCSYPPIIYVVVSKCSQNQFISEKYQTVQSFKPYFLLKTVPFHNYTFLPATVKPLETFPEVYALLTVQLGIILVNNQTDAHLLFLYVYFNSLHVSSNQQDLTCTLDSPPTQSDTYQMLY
jgi:hypothetical protein